MSDAAVTEPGETADRAPDAPGRGKTTFPVTEGRERGYDRAEVEDFLARARATFEGTAGSDALTADDVREAGFPLVKSGFRVPDVDAALGRIEEAFATRERERAVDATGPARWVDAAREEAQVLLDRLTRPERERFSRVGWTSYGYRPSEVDRAADRIVAFLQHGDPLDADQVRGAAFRMVRRGYREEQVDAVLDAVVRVILAVR